jgi:chromosome segregation ATPase
MRRIDEELGILEADLAEKIKNYTEITAALSADAEQIDAQKNRIYELHSTISNKNSEINSLLSLQNTLDKRKEQILTEKESGGANYRELTEQYENAKKELASLKNLFAQMEEESQALKQKYNEGVFKEKKLARELEELKISIGQISTRKKMIEERKAPMRDIIMQ